jgi:hypothetical protein
MALAKKLALWLLLLALVYVLSIGPYVYMVGKKWMPEWAMRSSDTFYAPVHFLEKQSWTSRAMDVYKRWWWRLSQNGAKGEGKA